MQKIRAYAWKIDRDLILTKNIMFNSNDINSDIIELQVDRVVGHTCYALLTNDKKQTAIYESEINSNGVATFIIDNSHRTKGRYELCFRIMCDDAMVESNLVSYSVVDGFNPEDIVIPESTLDMLATILNEISTAIVSGEKTVDDIGLKIGDANSVIELLISGIENGNSKIEDIENAISVANLILESISKENSVANQNIDELKSTHQQIIESVSSIKNELELYVVELKENLSKHEKEQESLIDAFVVGKKEQLEEFKDKKILDIEESIESNFLLQRQEVLEFRMDRLEVFRLGDTPNPKLIGVIGILNGNFGYWMKEVE